MNIYTKKRHYYAYITEEKPTPLIRISILKLLRELVSSMVS